DGMLPDNGASATVGIQVSDKLGTQFSFNTPSLGNNTALLWTFPYFDGQAQYADLNGDGKADLIFQEVDDLFWVSLSTGAGFTPPAPWVNHGGGYLKGQAQYADLNGDGKADLIMQGLDNTFWVSLSTGTTFTFPTPWVVHGGSFLEGQAQYAD